MQQTPDFGRRRPCRAAAATAASALGHLTFSERSHAMDQATHQMGSDAVAIRPFKYNATGAEIADLRRRIEATRWPEKETVADTSQGVPLAPLQDLARYWATDYDWRKCDAKLNALPQFITEIDGLDIHFIHG